MARPRKKNPEEQPVEEEAPKVKKGERSGMCEHRVPASAYCKRCGK